MAIDIADVIASIESSGNQFAQRFEKLHQGTTRASVINNIIAAHGGPGKLSDATADIYAACSHGLFQIMGYMLYGPTIDYHKPLWVFLTQASEQKAVFNKFLMLDNLDKLTIDDLKNDHVKRDHFAALYNGPGDIADYSAKMLATITQLESVTGA